MKKLSIILVCVLVVLAACTKSKEVHPEIGDGNDEIMTVGMKDVHVEYTRTDHAELQKVVFHYSLAELQQFEAAEMTKRETFFELTLNDLASDTLYDYYYELFYNGGETPITEQKTFHTQAFDAPEPPTPPTPPSGVPEGAINGLFTINANGDQVYFSQGNLQYQASTNTWRFAENQWDFVGSQNPYLGSAGGTVSGSDNSNISPTYNGWIDLFGWGTSGYNHGANCYQPWSTSTNDSDYYAYGSWQYNLYDQTGQADWGYNAIINGGNQENQWRTLTYNEWKFILFLRTTTSDIRYAKAIVNNVSGLILLPDDWSSSAYSLSNTNSSGDGFSSNTITATQWTILEDAGAVFLPAAGYRHVTSVYNVGSWGNNWSASYGNSNYVYDVDFFDSNLYANYSGGRYYGESVRLVQDSNP